MLSISAATYVFSTGIFDEELLAREDRAAGTAVWSAPPSAPFVPVGETIRRDPFAGKPLEGTVAAPAPASIVVPDIGALPADLDAPQPGAKPATLELKATVAGARAVAYVKDGSAMDIVHVGSRLGGRTIAAIGLHGIAFDDGTRLELSAYAQPAPHLRPDSAAASKLDEVRRLILRVLQIRRPLGDPAVRTPSVKPVSPASPPASPFATLPPPGPLPTIVPDFLPVGVSPTADPNGPTPYPLPPLRPPY